MSGTNEGWWLPVQEIAGMLNLEQRTAPAEHGDTHLLEEIVPKGIGRKYVYRD